MVAARLARDQALRRAVSRSEDPASRHLQRRQPLVLADGAGACAARRRRARVGLARHQRISRRAASGHVAGGPRGARVGTLDRRPRCTPASRRLRNDMTMCIRERLDVRPWSDALIANIARVEEIWTESRRRFGRAGRYLMRRVLARGRVLCAGRVPLPDVPRRRRRRRRANISPRCSRIRCARMGSRGAGGEGNHRRRRAAHPLSRQACERRANADGPCARRACHAHPRRERERSAAAHPRRRHQGFLWRGARG